MIQMNNNVLIHSDNLIALNHLLSNGFKGKVDLVYIDPPYATGGNFTITNGRATTISNSKNGNIAYTDTLKGTDFIDFLRARLLLLKELLSDCGSIYLHIDYKIGHYVKTMMDEVFGMENFRNDITRIKCNPKNFDRVGYGNIKDLIVKTSSNEKSIVLDCFCGSGTTLKSAQISNRYWIGIDESDLAIQATMNKLGTMAGDLFASKPEYEFLELNKSQHTVSDIAQWRV